MSLRWLLVAVASAAATIVLHEVAHYLGALAMGAENINLHWADVTYAAGSLEPFGEAVTWAAGPLLTHGIILAVWLSQATGAVPLAMGIGACTRDILLLPFAIKTVLGRDISGFSGDEVTVASSLGIDPLPLALLAVLLGLVGMAVFLRRGFKTRGMLFCLILIAGVFLGIVLWGAVGPIVLPGGKGFG